MPMTPSIKAALTSALVFPGLGHFILKRRARGCLFLLPSALALLYLVQQIMARASALLAQIDSGALTPDPQAIADQLLAAGPQSTLVTLATVIVAVCWAGSIIDAFFIKECTTAKAR
jgi:hypothetical protein